MPSDPDPDPEPATVCYVCRTPITTDEPARVRGEPVHPVDECVRPALRPSAQAVLATLEASDGAPSGAAVIDATEQYSAKQVYRALAELEAAGLVDVDVRLGDARSKRYDLSGSQQE